MGMSIPAGPGVSVFLEMSMTLFDMKAFYRWLNEASEAELLYRRDALTALLAELTEPDTKASASRFIRLVEAELLDRRLSGR